MNGKMQIIATSHNPLNPGRSPLLAKYNRSTFSAMSKRLNYAARGGLNGLFRDSARSAVFRHLRSALAFQV